MMTKNILKMAFALAITGAALTSCKKDNGTTPTGGSNSSNLVLGIKADNSATSLSSIPGSNVSVNDNSNSRASVTFTSGIANISGFKLEAKKNGVEKEISTSAMATVDLFAITPATVSALIDTGTYREIEIRVNLVKSTTATLPLVLKGNFTSAGGAVVPVEIDYNDDATIKIETPDNFVVDGSTNIVNTLTFHLNKLLNGISSAEIDAATRTGGTIVISNAVNTGIYNKIKANLSSSGDSGGFSHRGKDN